MPRRQFIADLRKAQDGVLPAGIHDLQPGEDDGQFEFTYTKSDHGCSSIPISITALIPDLGAYPNSHEYMIFSCEDATPDLAQALQNVRRTAGKTVFELLDIISTHLSSLTFSENGDVQMNDVGIDNDIPDEDGDEFDDEDVYDSDHEAFETNTLLTTPFAQPTKAAKSTLPSKAFRTRVRSDLLAAKQAGFKVGVLGHLLDGFNAFVTLSIRISKLGISEEAMQAWQVQPSDYLTLIIQYPNGYKTSEQLQGFDSIRLEPNIGMRVCAGKKYKPTLQEAIQAFAVATQNDGASTCDTKLPNAHAEAEEPSIRDTFISRPLNELLRARLIPILRLRGLGVGWGGAEELCLIHENAGARSLDTVQDRHFIPEPVNETLPDIVNDDHLSSPSLTHQSFPLLAMRFVLRHFVRCTEFCLNCNRKLNTDLEAIKPYVCDQDLCLYQYMTLGFGPSIEHEIAAQPYVVDLLVSFCYNSAFSRRLKEYPDGLSLTVPPPDQALLDSTSATPYSYSGRRGQMDTLEPKRDPQKAAATTYDVGLDLDRKELIFHEVPESCPVRRGEWIVLKVKEGLETVEMHCRVSDATYFPTIAINEPIALRMPGKDSSGASKITGAIVNKKPDQRPVSPAQTPKYSPATFQIYCEDFKSLTKHEKCQAICKLLDTLPDVKSLQEYVTKRSSADLKSWKERISPAALSLLRWIIVSNRACIMQVDGDDDGPSTVRKGERLSGMKDYMQFRFAMGAPDKEQRFINEVRKTTERLKLRHPTMFAWHGSPLYNWHMIIREGLHFKNVDHGRAYGDGVYHAPDASTSGGYSGARTFAMNGNYQSGHWPNSVLRVSSALALNEIVNAPTEFTSASPYYVVKQLDWIQTRYLFVQCDPTLASIKIGLDDMPLNALNQDPLRVPRGVSGPIEIPASAIKSRTVKDQRRPGELRNPSPYKKLKGAGGSADPIPIDDDDVESVETDVSDLNIFIEDEPEPEQQAVMIAAPAKPQGPPTHFIPGTLDFSKLPLMPLPTYATSATTKRLMKDLQTVAKIQDATPLGELGWYIDVEKIDNAYQWIVELHSFHTFEINGKPLPLAEDMKKRDIKSVVLEMRFNKDFPFTPPYVRVIRPRFKSIAQGGGGHIVMGGAMCMELLTNTGWSSVSSMESVLMQVRMAIASEPFARLDNYSHGDYGTGEAADGYVRACQAHGWQVPPGFRDMAYGTGRGGTASLPDSM